VAGPEEKLDKYRSMRDFTVTAEPAGAEPVGTRPSQIPPATTGNRFVVQRHRARRLHYDLRLEVGGVLVSWAVPKGPSLDPNARQLAVHVEDHPLEYFDFEGVIPKGEYGGGDVIVWDWGRWEPARTTDPEKAIARGELHFDLEGRKLKGRFVLVRRDREAAAKEQWLLFHKADEHAVVGWSPEDHLRSVKTGRTNEEVAAAPAALWRGDRPAGEAEVRLTAGPPPAWGAPTADELAALDDLGREGRWTVGGLEVKLTNLDKVLFPPRPGTAEGPATKRDFVRYHALVAPFMLPYLYDRPVNTHRYPDGVDRPGFWHKEVPSHAPEWLRQWRNDEAGPGETSCYAVVDSVAALVWMANFGAVELHGWTSAVPEVQRPTWALIDIDPGEATSFDDAVLLARLYRTALEHLGVTAMPKVTGQRGIQIWAPITPGPSFEQTRGWVEKVSRAVGATVPELVSWEWHKDRRRGLARLDFTQNAINKTLVAPFSARPAPGAPVSVPITWDELDSPDLRPDRWTVRTVLARLAEVGDPLHALIGRPQVLPAM
jgi:bifunctional non-homologous end joining protein LigD